MNTIQKVIAGICIMSIPFIGSCGKDDPVSCNFATEVQPQVDALSASATVYANNPTTDNCNAYKASFQAYINALESHRSCANAAGQQAEIDAAISSAQASVDAIHC